MFAHLVPVLYEGNVGLDTHDSSTVPNSEYNSHPLFIAHHEQ